MPGDTLAPLVLAVGLAVLFTGGLFQAWWAVALSGAICAGALLGWFWPRRRHVGMEVAGD